MDLDLIRQDLQEIKRLAIQARKRNLLASSTYYTIINKISDYLLDFVNDPTINTIRQALQFVNHYRNFINLKINTPNNGQ